MLSGPNRRANKSSFKSGNLRKERPEEACEAPLERPFLKGLNEVPSSLKKVQPKEALWRTK